MVSQLKVNEIIKQSGSSITIGVDGDTVSGPFTNTPSFLAYLGSNQTFSTDTVTKIQLNTVSYDTDNGFDNTTNYRYTVPSGKGGKYVFHLSGRTDLAIDTFSYILIKKNGVSIERSYQGVVKPNASGTSYMVSSAIVDMAVGDYVELYIFQNSNSNQLAYANYCSLSGMRLIGA